MGLKPEDLDALVAAGLTAEQIALVVKTVQAATVAQGPRAVSVELRAAVLSRDGHACVYCGSRQDLVCDHVVPYSRGGPTSLDNLVAACRSCNASKKDRTPEEWRGAP